MIRRDLWFVRGLHLALAASIPMILIFLAGCKVAKETKEDLGPEYSNEQVDEALSKAITGYTFRYIHVGQFVHYEMSRRLENQETTTNLGNLNVDVKAIKDVEPGDDPNVVTYIVRADSNTRNMSGGFDQVIVEEPLRLIYDPSLSSALESRGAQSYSAQSLKKQVSGTAEELPVTYHHLRTFSDTIDVPAAVRATPDCGGIPDCKLHVNFIQVQMVIWKSESSYQKVMLDLGFSPDMPFLPYGKGFEGLTGLTVQDCRSTYVPIEKRTVYVRDCMNLTDFRRNEIPKTP